MFNNLVGQNEIEIRKNKQEYLFYKIIHVWVPTLNSIVSMPLFVLSDSFYLRKGPVKSDGLVNHNASISALALLGVACDWLAHERLQTKLSLLRKVCYSRMS